MKINAPFAAVEGRVLGSVDKTLQVVFDLAGGRELDKAIVARVKTADETGDAASRSSQTKINTAVYFHVEIGIADEELERRGGWAPREKFLRRRRAWRVGEIERELRVLSKIVNRARRAADRQEFLILLTR